MTSAAGTNRSSASRSMKRRINHGHATRSIFGRSRVIQRIGTSANGDLARQSFSSPRCPLAAFARAASRESPGKSLVDPIEKRDAVGFTVGVRTRRPPPKNGFDPRHFGADVPAVPKVDFVDDFRDRVHGWVLQAKRPDHRLERAQVAVMTELAFAHVEGLLLR